MKSFILHLVVEGGKQAGTCFSTQHDTFEEAALFAATYCNVDPWHAPADTFTIIEQ